MSAQKPNSGKEPGYGYGGGYGGYGGVGGYGAYGQYGQYGQYGGYAGYVYGYGQQANPLAQYLVMVRERMWYVVLSILVFVTAALIYTVNATPEYQANGRLRVYKFAPNIAGRGAGEEIYAIMSTEDFNTAVEVMRSTAIIESVERRLTASERKAVLEPYQAGNIFSGPLTSQEVFARQRGIAPQRATLVVNVQFTHPDRDLARQLARLFCEAIQKNSEDERLTVTNPLVEKARVEIESLEERLSRLYREKNELVQREKLLSIARGTDTLGSERASLVKDREDVRRQIDELAIVWQQVAESRAAGKDLTLIPMVRSDERVAQLANRQTELQVTLRTMEEKYTESHPSLRLTREQLAVVAKELVSAADLAVARIDSQRGAAEQRKASVERALQAKEQEIARLQNANIELERIEKDIRLSEEFLSRLKLSYEDAKLRTSTTGTSTSVRILDQPTVSDRPINKNYYLNVVVGLGLGAAFGLGLVILLGVMDDRIKSASDIEGGVGLPLLGTIPRVRHAYGPDRALLGRQNKDRMAIESLRAIHSVMKINPAAAGAKVLLTTSTRPGEGKTFVTTNVALTFAQHGERVIVLDADLRLPNVAASLAIDSDAGISKYFNGEITLDQAIIRGIEPNLDILPVGSTCKNPTQVINSPKFAELIAELRNRYDRILIDSPPLGAVSDALHMVSLADGVLYVVRFSMVKKRNALSCVARLREAGVPIVGAILNSMVTRMASFYTDSYDESYRKYYAAEGEIAPEVAAPAPAPKDKP